MWVKNARPVVPGHVRAGGLHVVQLPLAGNGVEQPDQLRSSLLWQQRA